ncbi:MAG: hypothetical protein MUF48_21025 [Pirellulaceae bacterium]|jgi:hypothetical protein|nr:hypothetical protein [Pirellulaceae bacterium]
MLNEPHFFSSAVVPEPVGHGCTAPVINDFDSNPPTITRQAGYSKHRPTDVIPLRQGCAERSRQWIDDKQFKTASEPLLSVTGKRFAGMMCKDLEAARTMC